MTLRQGFNTYDKIYYGTQAAFDADIIANDVVSTITAKAFVYGDATTAGKLYVSNGTIFTLVE